LRESVVEKHLAKRVREVGGAQRKVVWPGRRGAPDRRVWLPRPGGGFVAWWVEMKAPGGYLEPHQAREIGKLEKLGDRVTVLYTREMVDLFIKRECSK
jgi:hypothetical protein